MKNLIFLLLTFCFTACARYPDVPYLVGSDSFSLQNLKKEAPYRMKNLVSDKGYTNLPSKLTEGSRSYKDWDIIAEKYKAEVKYFIRNADGKNYIRRDIYKWTDDSIGEIHKPSEFYELLKKGGIKDYEILVEKTWNYPPDTKIEVILLIYNGVKHQIKINKYVDIESYPIKDKDYWESQGHFMLDTPLEVEEKYRNANKN